MRKQNKNQYLISCVSPKIGHKICEISLVSGGVYGGKYL